VPFQVAGCKMLPWLSGQFRLQIVEKQNREEEERKIKKIKA
jgi:hypothetical protein